jgi:hypothetical protein
LADVVAVDHQVVAVIGAPPQISEMPAEWRAPYILVDDERLHDAEPGAAGDKAIGADSRDGRPHCICSLGRT